MKTPVEARPDDVDALTELENASFQSDRLTPEQFRRAIASPRQRLWAVRGDGGRLLAYLLARFRQGGRGLRIYSVAVDAAFRGQGLAHRLLDHAERHARRQGFTELTLEVRKHNPAALALYAAHGFTPERLLPAYYEDGEDGLRMRKVLGPRPKATRRAASVALVVGREQDKAMLEETAHRLGAVLLTGEEYLTGAVRLRARARYLNLCAVEDYQSQGYYVSLIGQARGHNVLPTIDTLTRLGHKRLYRDDLATLNALLAKTEVPETDAPRRAVEVYFGHAREPWARRLGQEAFRRFAAPVLELELRRGRAGWVVGQVWPLSSAAVDPPDRAALLDALANWAGSGGPRPVPERTAFFDLAVLVDPREKLPPSNEGALRRLARVGAERGVAVRTIGPRDHALLGTFDALFVRATTSPNHFTFQFARAAERLGMPVIDDPQSIIRCSNKVYLHESLAQAGLPTPRSVLLTRRTLKQVAPTLGWPAVLKVPDSAFSRGVVKVPDEATCVARALEMLEHSYMILAQEFMPSEFDWRVGVLDGEPLFACKYYMSHRHWQIYRHTRSGRVLSGDSETLPPSAVPVYVLEAALGAAGLMGDGLYGVDLKEREGRAYVIEVNDNPNIDHGVEDTVGGLDVYERVIDSFVRRMKRARGLS